MSRKGQLGWGGGKLDHLQDGSTVSRERASAAKFRLGNTQLDKVKWFLRCGTSQGLTVSLLREEMVGSLPPTSLPGESLPKEQCGAGLPLLLQLCGLSALARPGSQPPMRRRL
jgi:hypothetical protein